MEVVLTRGAVAAIAASQTWEVSPAARRAVLQVVDVSAAVEPPVVLGPRGARRRPITEGAHSHSMVLSDGVHTLGKFSLSTPLEHNIRDGRIRKGTVLRLLEFCCNVMGTDKITIFHFEVLRTEYALIGSPMPYQRGLEHAVLEAKSLDDNVVPRSSTSRRRFMSASAYLRLFRPHLRGIDQRNLKSNISNLLNPRAEDLLNRAKRLCEEQRTKTVPQG